MTSRERVVASLRGGKVDRIPFDFGSTLVTGITRGAYLDLAGKLGRQMRGVSLYDVAQQLAEVEEGILQRLGVDVRGLVPNIVRKSPQVEHHGDYDLFTDEWGLVWKRPTGGLYFDVIHNPLAGDIDRKDIDKYPWPDPADESLLQGLKEKADKFHGEGRGVILENVCAGIFEMSCRMRGFEQFCLDLALNPPLACALMDKFVELKIGFYHLAAEHLSGRVQFIREGDDVGGQESLLISPELYRKYLKPRHARLFASQRKLFQQPFFVFFHSDGAIYDLIPDFIEAGVDVLNPVQMNARGMDPAKLKREFGNDVGFWGGAVAPALLARGPAAEIEDQVRRHIQELGPDGRYVFAAVHNVQDDVPAENFMAMWKAFDELRDY